MTDPQSIARFVDEQLSKDHLFVHLQGLPFAQMEPREREIYIRQVTGIIGNRTLTKNIPDSDLWILDHTTSPSPDRIPFHTDNPTQEQPERLVSFWNIMSSDQGGENVLLPFQSVFDQQPHLEELSLKDITQIPRTFTYQNERLTAPVLDNQHILRFDPRYMAEQDQPFAKHLSRLLDRLGPDHGICIKLAPGDVLFFDNHRVFHAREPYTDLSRVSIRVRLHPFFRTIVSH